MNERIRVLMVDDEKRFRATTKKLLGRRGFETILAENGEEALEKLKENPDVVILDIKMPGMDGHQVLREIKKRSPYLPIIMLTGHGALPSARESLVEGAYDYLTKPCDITILAGKIHEAFEHRIDGRRSPQEMKVNEVMIPLHEYTTIHRDQTVKEAMIKLKMSFLLKMATNRIMETGHRSLLVLDGKGEVQGILSITDLLKAIMPGYLSAAKPSTADSIQYSPMFWKGMFTSAIQGLIRARVEDIMSQAPLSIEEESNLMEAAHMMITQNVRRLLVFKSGKTVGVIREQDLFFEMERIQRNML
jgi:DNA-binding response OmpR family regulator